MIFSDIFYNSLYEKVKYYIENTEALNMLLLKAQKSIKDKTWDKTAAQFNNIIQS